MTAHCFAAGDVAELKKQTGNFCWLENFNVSRTTTFVILRLAYIKRMLVAQFN